MRRRIAFNECDSADEVCGWLNKIRADQDQIEAKIIQNAQEIEALKSKKKGRSKMKFKGFAITRVLAIMMLIVAMAGLCYAAYVPTDITYEIAANPESLSIYLRDVTNNMQSNSYLFTPTLAVDAPPLADGRVWYNNTANILQISLDGTTWTNIALAGGNSLDAAYDVSEEITVDSGTAVTFTSPDNSGNQCLLLTQSDITNDGDALSIANAANSGTAVSIDIDGTAGFDIQGTGDLWEVSVAGVGDFAGLVVGATDLIFVNGEFIHNDVDAMFEFDSDQEDFTIDLTGNNIVGFSSDTAAVTLEFNALDNLTGIQTITFDQEDGTISLNSGGTGGRDLLITQLANAGGDDSSLILNSAGTGDDAIIISSDAGIDVDAAGSIVITSTENAVDSIVIQSTAGGIDILCDAAGSGEDIDIVSTGGSVNISATEGVVDGITITSTGGGIDITAATDGAAEDLDIALTGATNSSIDITSAGTGADALILEATAGGIDIDAADDIDIKVTSSQDGEDLLLTQTGTFNASIILLSAGTGPDAISLTTSNSAGDIVINSGDKIDMDSAGTFALNVAGETLLIQVDSDGAGDDLTLNVDGDDDSHILISSDGTSINTIQLLESGTGTGGGILIRADTGTAYADAAASITLLSDVGGIGIKATGLAQNDAIVINAAAGGVNIDAATSYDVAINGGQVKIEAEDNVTSAISLITNTGTTETIVITNTLGDSDAAINIDATAGGYALDAAKSIVLTSSEAQADAIQITTSDGSGGIVLNAGNSIISMSDDDISNVGDLAVDDIVADANDNVVISAVKCLVVTISSDDSPDTDFNFDNSQANQTEQGIRVGLIPAYSEIIAVFIRCTETVTASTTMGIEVGTATGGNQIVATSDCDTANDTMGTATGESPEIAASSTAISVWISATPGTNWNTPHNEGSWTICILYADYAAAMSESG